ncbi:MAG TPA: cysteine--tRNA ligase, partial [Candidatus Obscuribacterales bacterium]|nr:cysteine--tRNA ligase [Candidatus Obscuribacterales bacterium]
QSESLHDKPLAKYWLHNSFINVSEEKMSKSLGNFKTIGDLLKEYSADTLRLFILQTHYRNPIEFSPEAMNGAKQALMRLLRASLFAEAEENGGGFSPSKHYRFDQKAAEAYKNDKTLSEFHNEFVAAMDNDFNTAVAISHLFGLADKISASKDANERKLWAKALKDYAGVLGFTLTDTRKVVDRNSTEQVLALLLQLRQDARANKDFKTSDLIRNELAKAGISVMDTAEGPTWEKT